ncbi:transketolase [Candidatus Woesearchaeota archaeon CG1_02_47_18]|nr:MAG: transketolase [Candidatus Woesearchaeota archaeon CG1_02_47_18]
MESTREAYGKALAFLGEHNKSLVVLDADLSKSTKSCEFAARFPERFFNVGVAEQNLIGIAAGLASCGKVPFANTFAVFASGRAYDQVRILVAYSQANVKVVGTHAGILTGEDGPTHQATEDIALMRALPNMTVVQPADGVETRLAVRAIADHKGPVYFRLVRAKLADVFDSSYKFELGKGVIARDGDDVAIVATGAMLHIALDAARLLESKKIAAAVINIHTIKPIDKSLLIKYAEKTGCMVCCEDHSIIGGLGSAVAEVLAQEQEHLIPIGFIGIRDVFCESGKAEELYKLHGLTAEGIAGAGERVIERKG